MSINRSSRGGRTGVIAIAALLLSVSVVGFALASSLPPGGSFGDDDGNIHEAAIEAIAAEGITKGCNPPINDLYCPSATVTRGQMAAFLVRALDLPATSEAPFSDAAGVFEDSINRLAAAGITKGCNPPTNDLFCPGSSVTRGQMAAFLVRALDLPATSEAPFGDAAGVFEDSINRLAAAGITKGCNPPTNDLYCPHSLVKRDQMASFLTRALGLTPIVPPPPTSSTTTTTGGPTPTTLPPVGPSATFTACGDDTVTDEFSVREPCIGGTVYNSTWAQASWPTVITALWLDSDGVSVSACPISGNCSVADFHYNSGFLMGWTFKFYAEGENRDLGPYYLEMWSGVSGDELQNLLLRDGFELSDIDPVPAPEPKPNVSWSCSNNPDGTSTCTGNIDTLDSATESWGCTPIPDPGNPTDLDYADWDCAGDIDKRTGGDESWYCTWYGDCTGNVDTSDSADEEWENSWIYNAMLSDGDIDKSDPGYEDWQCYDTATGLSCSSETHPWEWTCEGEYRGDWTCSGTVGRLAPIVGPVPADWGEW